MFSVVVVLAGAAWVLPVIRDAGTRPIAPADELLRQELVAAYVQATYAERVAGDFTEVVVMREALMFCPIAGQREGRDCDLLVEQLEGPQRLSGTDRFAPEALQAALAKWSSERGPRLSRAIKGARLGEDDHDESVSSMVCPPRGPVQERIKFSPAVVDAQGAQALMWVRQRYCDGSTKLRLVMLVRDGGRWRPADLEAPSKKGTEGINVSSEVSNGNVL